ncbi:MAG TPA: TIGR01777 family oxidoreductase [Prolixibacteraceae bacterium]|nr:TIGR01777 family oxidoreductase [Prolixibacteraceae bacterium]
MKIVITGGTGFLGRHLSSYLVALGHEIVLIQRSDLMKGADQISKLVKSSDVLINLAGSPVIKRWTTENRKEMLDSRLNTTNMLVGALTRLSPGDRPSIFLSASAIGIYDSINVHNESSVSYDNNFLADVCRAWEGCLEPLGNLNTRVCIMRIGIVLGRDGGMLKKLIPLFKAGLGGKIGSGKQAFSFIHYLDFCKAVHFLITNEACKGIFNLTAPEFSNNETLTRILAAACHRPAFFTVPEAFLKIIYGEAAVSMISGQSVYPQHLLDCGFKFLFPDLNSAVSDIVSQGKL